MFVELPEPVEKKQPPEGASVVFVELPPKSPQQQQQQQQSDFVNNNSSISNGHHQTSVVMRNGDTDVVCIGQNEGQGQVQGRGQGRGQNSDDSAGADLDQILVTHGSPRMHLCSGSGAFPAFPVPTLAIIPPTPLSDTALEHNALFNYIDDEEDSDYAEYDLTSKRLISQDSSQFQ